MSEPKASEAVKQMAADAFMEASREDRDFFFRNAIKIRPKGGRKLVPLEMRPAQRRLADLIDKISAQGRSPRIIILKARRLGFSTFVLAESLRRAVLWPHLHHLLVAHKSELSEALFAALTLAYDNLPEAIRPEKKYATKQLVQFKDNNSRVEVEVAGEVRGYSGQFLHLSELAFVKDAAKLMTAATVAIPTDDPHSAIIIESTPNGIGNEFHEIWKRAQSGRSEWVPFFVPWYEDPTYTREPWFTLDELNARTDAPGVRAAEIVRLHGVSLEQIAWWLHTLENSYFGDLDRMEQEMATDPFSCFLASGSRVFDRDGLKHYFHLSGFDPERDESPDDRERRALADERMHDIVEVLHDHKHPRVEKARGGKLWIARHPTPRHEYIWAWDISAGDPYSDPGPGVCLNRHTLDVDAIWDGRVPPEVLARIADLCAWYYNGAKIVGEGNNHGVLFHHVLFNECRYPLLHYRKTSQDSTSGKVTDKLGFWTHGENREHIFNLVRRYVREKAGRVEYERMVLEWAELQRDEASGRVDHPDGGTSDLTIALGMALAVHAGDFEATLQPLTDLEQNRVADLVGQIRSRRAFGRDTRQLEEALDLTGVSEDDALALEAALGKRRESRRSRGLDGCM